MNAVKKSVLITFVALSTLVIPVLAVTRKPVVVAQKQTTMMTPKVEYLLPFPGILPDNPLYFLKAGRDRIMDFLIVDPVRKAEFYILQADKRLGMAVQLSDKGNATLAETTLSKGETYMEKAVSTLANYKAGGKEIPGYLLDRLIKSLAKHVEVLSERSSFSSMLEQVKKLQAQADSLK